MLRCSKIFAAFITVAGLLIFYGYFFAKDVLRLQ